MASDPGDGRADITVTVRPEWIKLGDEAIGPRSSSVGGTVVDVVYLGSVTQLRGIVCAPVSDSACTG